MIGSVFDCRIIQRTFPQRGDLLRVLRLLAQDFAFAESGRQSSLLIGQIGQEGTFIRFRLPGSREYVFRTLEDLAHSSGAPGHAEDFVNRPARVKFRFPRSFSKLQLVLTIAF